MSDLPLLWHFPISHYNEKARWALDYKRVPHRRQVLAADYVPRVWWATGRRSTLPVLHLDGRIIGDSTEIIAAVEKRWPDPALYPDDAGMRERALALEDWLDEEIGHPVRTLLVSELMEAGAGRIADTLFAGMGAGAKRMLRLVHPVFRRFYYERHGIAAESRRDAPEIVHSAFDRLENELADSAYLVGDGFSVADLTAASILAPLVRPPGTLWAELGAFPDAVERFLQPLGSHRTTAYVRQMYARHRGESAAVV